MSGKRKFVTGELDELIDSAWREFDGYPHEDDEIIRAYHKHTEGYAFDLDDVREAFIGSTSGTLEEWFVNDRLPEIVGEDVLKLLTDNHVPIDAHAVDTTGVDGDYVLIDGYVFING